MEITTKINYIHAERISEGSYPHMNVNIQLSVPSSEPHFSETDIDIPFILTVNTTPPVYEIVIKGIAKIKGQEKELENLKNALEKKKNLPSIMQTITSVAIFEAALLSRELGFPPLLPIPTQKASSNPPMGLQPI